MHRGWFLLLALLPGISTALEFSLESVLSPGNLSSAHAEWEHECNRCHVRDGQGSENQRCLSCHEAIEQDIRSSEGFHGRKIGLADGECRLCHSEHQGKQSDILDLNPSIFSHKNTDFPLKGTHASVACESCHDPSKSYRQTPSQCVDCHRSEDVHKGSLGMQCEQCHAITRWLEGQFNHDNTGFPLDSGHATLSCARCHGDQTYQGTESQCKACHQGDDVHLGALGGNCGECHSATQWQRIEFNHNRDTRFPLRGQHRELSCNRCHGSEHPLESVSSRCVSCHKKDDRHFGRNGEACSDCHSETNWKTSLFNHNLTDFPLKGAHKDVACQQCHVDSLDTPIPDTSCFQCHADGDPHQGSMGRDCESCHQEDRWQAEVLFDHDLSNFPLLGMHAVIGCEGCHTTAQFKGTRLQCQGCHQSDPHQGSFGDDCQSCHHPMAWDTWHFDHNTQTAFALTGAHQGLACMACHEPGLPAVSSTSGQCGSCHAQDDVHRGAYGNACEDCHSTKIFTDIRLR